MAKQRKVDIEALLNKLRDVASQGDAAADAAAENFIATSPLSQDGHIGDSAGFAVLRVINPSYHFRKALLTLDPKARSSPGIYPLPVQYRRRRTEQSYWFHKHSCEGALTVWRHYFPEEEFRVDSWGD